MRETPCRNGTRSVVGGRVQQHHLPAVPPVGELSARLINS